MMILSRAIGLPGGDPSTGRGDTMVGALSRAVGLPGGDSSNASRTFAEVSSWRPPTNSA